MRKSDTHRSGNNPEGMENVDPTGNNILCIYITLSFENVCYKCILLSVGTQNVQDTYKPQFKTYSKPRLQYADSNIQNAIISDVNISRNVNNTPQKPRQFIEPTSPPTPGTPDTPQTPQALPRDTSKPIYDHTPLPPSQPHMEEIEQLKTLQAIGSKNETHLTYESSNKNYKKTYFVYETENGKNGRDQYTSPNTSQGIFLFQKTYIYIHLKHKNNYKSSDTNKQHDTYIHMHIGSSQDVRPQKRQRRFYFLTSQNEKKCKPRTSKNNTCTNMEDNYDFDEDEIIIPLK
jgi:hypothetical protein